MTGCGKKMKRIKLENEDVLTYEQNRDLESRICTLYKDGTCQVLSKTMHGSFIPLYKSNISFVGRTCDDRIGFLCGWYPVQRME